MTAKPATPDDYLAQLTPERRARLEVIRAAIQSACPQATEAMVYSMPGFRLGSAAIGAYAAAKTHDGLYPCSGSVIAQLPEIQARFSTSKGTVHLPLDAPVPEDVVRLVIATRLAELARD
jgi:uncharacterized protein YdhG (YjbR/CyaY superfamily)